MRLEDGNGLDVIEIVRGRRPDARAIILTGYGNIATAVTAVKLGAIDYLSKPADADEIYAALMQQKDQRAAAAGKPDVGRPRALGAYPARLRAVRPQRLGDGAPPQHASPHAAAHPGQARPALTAMKTGPGQAEIVIRALEVEDAQDLARLQDMPGYRYGTLRPPFPSITSVRKRLEQNGPETLLLGAFVDARLVGSAGLHRHSGRRSHAANIGMGVADDMEGRGIGTALLRALIEAADKWLAIDRLELTVFHDNERAIRLYERHGFQREGTFRAFAFRDGEFVDAVAMARLRSR